MVEYPNEPIKNTVDIGTNLITLERWFDSKFANYDYALSRQDYKINQLQVNNLALVSRVGVLENKVADLEDSAGTGDINEYVIDLELLGSTTITARGGNLKFNVDWGDGTIDSNKTHTYTLKDGDSKQFTLKSKDILVSNDMQKCCIAINKLMCVPNYDFKELDMFKDTTLNLFYNFKELRSVGDITGKIKDLTGMFKECVKLEHPGNLTEGAEILDNMYYKCYALMEGCKLPNTVKSAKGMYLHCSSLHFMGELNEGLTDISDMYCYSGLLLINQALPSTVTTAESAFCGTDVDKVEWNIFDKVTIDNGKFMFSECKKLKEISGEINHIKNGSGLFQSCGFSIMPKFASDNILENADYMFFPGTTVATKLESYGGNTLPNSVTSMKYCFAHTNVTEVLLPPSGITDKLAFTSCYSDCEKLTDVSNMMDFISTHTDNNNNNCFLSCLAITTPGTAKELLDQYPGWSFNHVPAD